MLVSEMAKAPKQAKYVLLHEKDKVNELFENLTLLSKDSVDVANMNQQQQDKVQQSNVMGTNEGGTSCSCCKVGFLSLEEQRQHFKLGWPR